MATRYPPAALSLVTANRIAASYLLFFGATLYASPVHFYGGGGGLISGFFVSPSEGRRDPPLGGSGPPFFDPMTSYHFRLAGASLLALGVSRFLFVSGDNNCDARERAWSKMCALPAVLSLALFGETAAFANAAFVVLTGAHLSLMVTVASAAANSAASAATPAAETDRRLGRNNPTSTIERVTSAISVVAGTAGVFLFVSPVLFFGANGGLIPFFGNVAEPDPVRLFSSRLLGACLSWYASSPSLTALTGKQQSSPDEREFVLRMGCLGGILNCALFLGNFLDNTGYFKRKVYGIVLLVQVLHVLLMAAALSSLRSERSLRKEQ